MPDKLGGVLLMFGRLLYFLFCHGWINPQFVQHAVGFPNLFLDIFVNAIALGYLGENC